MFRQKFFLAVIIPLILASCNTDKQKVKVVQQQNNVKTEDAKNESSDARDTWPKDAKIAYIDRCTESLNSQGLSTEDAKVYCTCLSNEMEAEFGMKEYDQMMEAEPNPNGSNDDKRLYNIFMVCQDNQSK